MQELANTTNLRGLGRSFELEVVYSYDTSYGERIIVNKETRQK
jgi:hypothetical protein